MLPGNTKTLYASGVAGIGNDSYTVLLLHFDSDYIDYSIGNTVAGVRTFVRGGGAQRGAYSKFGAGGLQVGGASTSGIRTAHSDDFNFGSGDWTIDYWCFRPAAGVCIHIAKRSLNAQIAPWLIHDSGNGVLVFYGSSDGTGWNVGSGVVLGTIPPSVWTHVAVQRRGSTIRGYINGVPSGVPITFAGALWDNTYTLGIGGDNDGNSSPYYFDEIRISKGIARYPADTFTPPIAAYGTDTFDKLLLHMDGANGSTTFSDASSASRGNATKLGNIQVSTATPKLGTGSALFDGTGDYLTYATHADWNMGTGNYSIDCWIRPNALAGTRRWIAGQGDTAGTGNSSWALAVDTDNTIKFYVAGTAGTTNAFTLTSTTTVANATWYHIAAARNGNVHTLYINGVPEAATIYTPTLFSSTTVMGIGSRGALTTATWNGNIDEFRIGKGIARWVTDFTPETKPYGPDPNRDTLLLLHFDQANNTPAESFIDSSVFNRNPFYKDGAVIVAAPGGNLGPGVGYFPSAYFVPQQSIDFDFMDNDFTMDWWEARTGDLQGPAFTRENDAIIYQPFLCGWMEGGVSKFYWSHDGANWGAGAPLVLGTIPAGIWTHYAVVRKGSTLYGFKNGVLQDTKAISGALIYCTANQYLAIGFWNNGPGYKYSGYMDEIRISKVARWTADFPVPTLPYDADPIAYQLIWDMRMDGPDGSTSFPDSSTWHREQIDGGASNASIQSNAAMFGPQTYIYTPNDSAMFFRNSDFTVETWLMPRGLPGGNYRYYTHATGASDSNANGVFLGYTSALALDMRFNTGGSTPVVLYTPDNTLPLWDWTHVVVVRSGNIWTLYVNGVAAHSVEVAMTVPDSANGAILGVIHGGTEWMDGYLNDFKIYKRAEYTADFTPPAKPVIPWGVLPATYISVALDRSTVRAGTAFGITFQCYNASGTTVNHSGTIHMTSDDPTATFSSNDFGMGSTGYITCTMNYPSNGTFTVTATSSAGITGTSAGMSVTHGPASPQIIFLSASNGVYGFTLPGDWSDNNSVEIIAGGAGGWQGGGGGPGYGGGGGGYGRTVNFGGTPGQVVNYYIGPHAGHNAYGGDAWFISGGVCHVQGGQANGGGGVYAANYVAYGGGAGGSPQTWAAGGGGGAAGPYGGGGPGGHGAPDEETCFGGGGGGSGGGAAGGTGYVMEAGWGGNSYAWGGGGPGSSWPNRMYGTSGVNGGGGGGCGGNAAYGGAGYGGNGPEYGTNVGSGGGGGGSGCYVGPGQPTLGGSQGGAWGGGGGGVGYQPYNPSGGGMGHQGLIIIRYQ